MVQIVQGNLNIAIKASVYAVILILGILMFIKLLIIHNIMPLIKHYFDLMLTW